MHRIDTKTAQKDKFGAGKNGFTRGNPQTGTPATDLDDDYFDMLQEELCSVVEASGANLEKGRHDQLLTALRALLLSRKNPFGDIKADGDMALGQALSNLGLTGDFISGVTRNSYLIIPVKYPATVTHIIIQFGVVNVVANSDTTVPFPIPFPSGGTVLIPVAAYSPGSGVLNTVSGVISGNNAIFRSAVSTTINWVAIGA